MAAADAGAAGFASAGFAAAAGAAEKAARIVVRLVHRHFPATPHQLVRHREPGDAGAVDRDRPGAGCAHALQTPIGAEGCTVLRRLGDIVASSCSSTSNRSTRSNRSGDSHPLCEVTVTSSAEIM